MARATDADSLPNLPAYVLITQDAEAMLSSEMLQTGQQT